MAQDNVRVIGNLELHKDYATVSINPKIYELSVVYSAAYVLMEDAYVVIDGDPESEILVEIRPKKGIKKDIETLGRKMNNELINYASYKVQTDLNRGVRESFVNRALGTVLNDECEPEEQNYLDDPLGIAKPWEETHGDSK